MPAPSAARRVVVGWIRKPVGLRGEVIVEPTGNDPGRFSPGRRLFVEGQPVQELRILKVRPAPRGGVVVLFEEIGSRNEAEELRGREITIRAEDLPPLPSGVYYHFQLIGLEVVDADGSVLGRVESILETGGNDVYCVGKGQEEILVPAVPDYVAKVDLGEGRILLAVPRSHLGEDEPPL